MAKKKTEKQVVVEKLLEKQNQSYTNWRKETLEHAQFAFFRGQEEALEAYVLERAMDQLLLNECKKHH